MNHKIDLLWIKILFFICLAEIHIKNITVTNQYYIKILKLNKDNGDWRGDNKYIIKTEKSWKMILRSVAFRIERVLSVHSRFSIVFFAWEVEKKWKIICIRSSDQIFSRAQRYSVNRHRPRYEQQIFFWRLNFCVKRTVAKKRCYASHPIRTIYCEPDGLTCGCVLSVSSTIFDSIRQFH